MLISDAFKNLLISDIDLNNIISFFTNSILEMKRFFKLIAN
jgi:hypothetical protein